MKYDKISATVFSILLILFSSCKNNRLETELEEFLGKEIIIPESLIGFKVNEHNSLPSRTKSKYKIVVYVDSLLSCSTCWVQDVGAWDILRKEIESEEDRRIFLIFNSSDVHEIMENIKNFNINIPFFLDIEGELKNHPNFPKRELFKTFITRNDTVILAGNPVFNSKLMDLYLSVTNGEK